MKNYVNKKLKTKTVLIVFALKSTEHGKIKFIFYIYIYILIARH